MFFLHFFHRIHLWFLVMVAAVFETFRHEAIQGVRGPSLADLALLLVVEAVVLIFVWRELSRQNSWRRLIVFVQVVLVAGGVVLFLWQKVWTQRVFAAAEAALQGPNVGHIQAAFREVVLTKNGLVFWCWVSTGLPKEKSQVLQGVIQSRIEGRVLQEFSSIKRVVAVAI